MKHEKTTKHNLFFRSKFRIISDNIDFLFNFAAFDRVALDICFIHNLFGVFISFYNTSNNFNNFVHFFDTIDRKI